MSIREAVTAIGEEPTQQNMKRLRRRLDLLDARSGGRILRTLAHRRSSGAKLWISKSALMWELRTDHARHDAELSSIRCQLEGVEHRLSGLGRAHRKLRRRVVDFENRQDSINRANTRAIEAIRELAHIVGRTQTRPKPTTPRAE
jgi:chromosome segregation ATPase